MKTFEEVWSEVAEEQLKYILKSNINLFNSDPMTAKENLIKAHDNYDIIREQLINGGTLKYTENLAWTVFDYDRFKFNKDKGFEPGHDNFDTLRFLDAYRFEDHWFYLAWIKGYETPMKIKMHVDPSSSIEVVSINRANPEHMDVSNQIYFWDWPENFLAFMPMPNLPIH